MRTLGIVTNDFIDLENYTSGQEYYIYVLKKVLEEKRNYHVNVIDFPSLLKNATKGLRFDVLHLYYLNTKQIFNIRRIFNVPLIYHVYHIKDSTWNPMQMLSWKTFLVSSQFLLDRYLATSRTVYQWLSKRVSNRRIVLIEPYYECVCSGGYGAQNLQRFNEFDELNLLYIGRLSKLRLPLCEIVKVLKYNLGLGKVKLTVVTFNRGLRFVEKEIREGSLTLKILNRRISKWEKCCLYNQSHFFLYLARGNVAMNPPITLIESVYHGVLPLVTPWVLGDLDIPSELVLRDLSDLPLKVKKITENLELIKDINHKLASSFKKFFDLKRYIRDLRYVLR